MIELKNIHIEYNQTTLLENEQLIIPDSSLTLITGKSGIGKTALLYRLACLSPQLDYQMIWNGEHIENYTFQQRTKLRRKQISFVLQENDLISHFSVAQNLQYYASLIQKSLTENDIKELLMKVELDVPFTQSIETLSLGERQRLAIACALVKESSLLLLDEPTSSLDSKNERNIFEILSRIAHQYHKMVVVVSHNKIAKDYSDCIYKIENQHLETIKEHKPTQVIHNQEKENTHYSLDYSFYQNYLKTYTIKYKSISVLMIMILTLIFVMMTMSESLITQKLEDDRSHLLSQYDNQIFITKSSDMIYLNNALSQFQMPSHQKNIYPTYKIKTLIQDKYINVIPYFDENEFTNQLQIQYEPLSKHGILLSESVYNTLKTSLLENNNQLDLTLTIEGKNNQNKDINYQNRVTNVFYKGVIENYISHDKNFIMIYYKDLDNLYQNLFQSTETIGYTQFFDNYDELKQQVIEYQNQGYGVNSDFVNLDNVNQILDYYHLINIITKVIIIAIGITFFLGLYMSLMKKRKKEFALLALNGISYKENMLIMLFEFLDNIKTSLLLSIGISFIIYLYLPFSYLSLIITYIIIIILLLCVVYLLTSLTIQKIDIEKTLRN